MRWITHEVWAGIIGFVSLALITNFLLIVSCLPLAVILITTDPASSWPLIAGAAALASPGITAAFRCFREHAVGGAGPVRAFVSGLRDTWARSLVVGAGMTAVVVVALVDIRMLAASPAAVLVVPLLAVVIVLTVSVGLLTLVAVSEAPMARMRDVVRAAAVLGLRRWYLTAASLCAIGAQFAVFSTAPAIGSGVTASVMLYFAWTNCRFTLRPVLDLDEAVAA